MQRTAIDSCGDSHIANEEQVRTNYFCNLIISACMCIIFLEMDQNCYEVLKEQNCHEVLKDQNHCEVLKFF